MTQEAETAALYVRVSSADQDLAGQERELVREAERLGWKVVEVYSEKVPATGKVRRTEYDRLMREAARPGRPWRHLLVWSLDRFSRAETFTQATQAILDLEKLAVRFHSLKESTLDTPEDGRPNLGRDVLLALLPVIASFESKRRSERVRLAMREIKEGRRRTRSGRPPGRPRRLDSREGSSHSRLPGRGAPLGGGSPEGGVALGNVPVRRGDGQEAPIGRSPEFPRFPSLIVEVSPGPPIPSAGSGAAQGVDVSGSPGPSGSDFGFGLVS